MGWVSDIYKWTLNLFNNAHEFMICALIGCLISIAFFSDPTGIIKEKKILQNLDNQIFQLILIFFLGFIFSALIIFTIKSIYKSIRNLFITINERRKSAESRDVLHEVLLQNFELFWECSTSKEKSWLVDMASYEKYQIISHLHEGLIYEGGVSGHFLISLNKKHFLTIEQELPHNKVAIKLSPLFQDWVKSTKSFNDT